MTVVEKTGISPVSRSAVGEICAELEKKIPPGAGTVAPVAQKTLASAAEPVKGPETKKEGSVVVVAKTTEATKEQSEKVDGVGTGTLPKTEKGAPSEVKKEIPMPKPTDAKDESSVEKKFTDFKRECVTALDTWKREYDTCKKPGFFAKAAMGVASFLGAENVDEKISHFRAQLSQSSSFKALRPVVEGWHKSMKENLPKAEKVLSKQQLEKVGKAITIFEAKLKVIVSEASK